MTFRNLAVTLLVLASAACDEPPPTASSEDAEAGAAAALTAAPAAIDPRAAVAAAVEDARTRILPAFQTDATLRGLREAKDLAVALDDLATLLAQDRGSLAVVLRRAERAVTGLAGVVKSNAGRVADLSAVSLVLDRAGDLER